VLSGVQAQLGLLVYGADDPKLVPSITVANIPDSALSPPNRRTRRHFKSAMSSTTANLVCQTTAFRKLENRLNCMTLLEVSLLKRQAAQDGYGVKKL